MKIGSKIILLGKQLAVGALILIASAACECIPGIDTDKEFDPDDASNVTFINAMPDIDQINLVTDVVTIENQGYTGREGLYHRIAAGDNNVRFQLPDADYPFFNLLSNFEKDKYYTLIGYGPGSGRKIRMLMLDDPDNGYKQEKTYLRFLHVMTNFPDESPPLLFVLHSDTPEHSRLKYTSFSSFDELDPGIFTIDIINSSNDSLLTSTEAILEKGRLYTMTAKGYFNGTGIAAPRYMLHSVPVPAE